VENLLQPLLDWIALHPHAAGVAVFVIALMESLIVLGLLIPGAVLLFGAGALMSTGALPVLPIMLWTIAGAICGDLISFLLGRHYHQQLRVIWPFRRYPALVNRGVDFFCKHGGKSVFMARFIGPLRPIVPAIAGMMNMTIPRFLLVDIVAAILWAPAYILPGMVFGASLGLAAEVAGRLVVLLVTVVGLAMLSVWLIHSLVRMLHPHASTLVNRILNWSRHHPRIRPLAGSLLDSDHPEARGLAILSVLFFVTLWLLLLIMSQVHSGDFLHGICISCHGEPAYALGRPGHGIYDLTWRYGFSCHRIGGQRCLAVPEGLSQGSLALARGVCLCRAAHLDTEAHRAG